jgi:hypothetical protein
MRSKAGDRRDSGAFMDRSMVKPTLAVHYLPARSGTVSGIFEIGAESGILVEKPGFRVHAHDSCRAAKTSAWRFIFQFIDS